MKELMLQISKEPTVNIKVFLQQRFLENFCYSLIYILILDDKKGGVLQSVQEL